MLLHPKGVGDEDSVRVDYLTRAARRRCCVHGSLEAGNGHCPTHSLVPGNRVLILVRVDLTVPQLKYRRV